MARLEDQRARERKRERTPFRMRVEASRGVFTGENAFESRYRASARTLKQEKESERRMREERSVRKISSQDRRRGREEIDKYGNVVVRSDDSIQKMHFLVCIASPSFFLHIIFGIISPLNFPRWNFK